MAKDHAETDFDRELNDLPAELRRDLEGLAACRAARLAD